MLKNAEDLPPLSSKLEVNLKPIGKRLIKLIITVLPTTLFTVPAMALDPVLGIANSSLHISQGSGINDHSPRLGIDHCVTKAANKNNQIAPAVVNHITPLLGWHWKSAQVSGSTPSKTWS